MTHTLTVDFNLVVSTYQLLVDIKGQSKDMTIKYDAETIAKEANMKKKL